ncbi:MAG TPA: hypothetical protein PLK06_01685 [bacterium]|nr:hypothetical protein [bacterium]
MRNWLPERSEVEETRLRDRLGVIQAGQPSPEQVAILNGLAQFLGSEEWQVGMGGAGSAVIRIDPFVDPPSGHPAGNTDASSETRQTSSSFVGDPIYHYDPEIDALIRARKAPGDPRQPPWWPSVETPTAPVTPPQPSLRKST